ncbi:uncharacterized protein BO80DRAFT_502910 [Aspergillus ibericus CBS 121593]|uniref:Carboxylic ester hydrolase n=1 Tax=Aspergillus ibericus CBS 121593 TaxID=1448316 RepID=A0A395GY66_9EURO|nr:hypothetical protein BO80DRAFT_502910 [Aspergillus ibericus CBS 121593]RAL00009.1 hypothetical protein BO80DRAFT_502910 [Aspergillus ibericus CBS 121593]
MKTTRKSTPKVRTGCITCKARRVKCDEAKPNCLRCTRAKRTCGGYPVPVPPTDTTATVEKITAYNIPFKVPGSQVDRQLLHFYCIQAASGLSSYSDPTLWNRLILQRCHHQPVIRYALVTLSALYQDHLTTNPPGAGGDRPAPSLQSLRLIARSHRQLRIHLSSPDASTEVALICSIIFYAFEALLGNAGQAIQHLDQGLILLQRCQATAPVHSATDDILPHLTALFSSLDVQASTYNDGRLPVLKLLSPAETSGLVPVVPDHFGTLVGAETTLIKLQNWMLRHLVSSLQYKHEAMENIPVDILHERHTLHDQFTKYIEAISTSITCATHSRISARLLLLRLQARMFRTILAENIPHLSMEESNPLQQSLRDLSTLLTSSPSLQPVVDGAIPDKRSFTLSTHLIAALYFICMKSTNPSTVDLALSLLRHERLPSRDGLWDAGTVEAVVQGIRQASTTNERTARENRLEDAGVGFLQAAGEGGVYEILDVLRRDEGGCISSVHESRMGESSSTIQPPRKATISPSPATGTFRGEGTSLETLCTPTHAASALPLEVAQGLALDSQSVTANLVYNHSVSGQISHVPGLSYNESTAALGDWYRLFLVPGAAHCELNPYEANGPYPQTNIGVMIDWVENGILPTTLNATHLAGPQLGASAQLCAFPLRPLRTNNGTIMECVYDQASLDTWQYDFDAWSLPLY